MARLMFSEDGRTYIRNFDGIRAFDSVGRMSRRSVAPGVVVILDRGDRKQGFYPDLEIHLSDSHKKSLVRRWLNEPKASKAAIVGFAIGAWSIWTAITLLAMTTP